MPKIETKHKNFETISEFSEWFENQRCWKCTNYVELEDDTYYCKALKKQLLILLTFDDDCDEFDEEREYGFVGGILW